MYEWQCSGDLQSFVSTHSHSHCTALSLSLQLPLLRTTAWAATMISSEAGACSLCCSPPLGSMASVSTQAAWLSSCVPTLLGTRALLISESRPEHVRRVWGVGLNIYAASCVASLEMCTKLTTGESRLFYTLLIIMLSCDMHMQFASPVMTATSQSARASPPLALRHVPETPRRCAVGG